MISEVREFYVKIPNGYVLDVWSVLWIKLGVQGSVDFTELRSFRLK